MGGLIHCVLASQVTKQFVQGCVTHLELTAKVWMLSYSDCGLIIDSRLQMRVGKVFKINY